CPSEVSSAIKKLDEMNLDVIIVARGGGSYEDLVGFSNEQVVRAAADCKTPIVSAIGHEGDWTLLDLVADRRCSTPTDVAKTIIPDFAQEEERVKNARSLLTSVMGRIVAMEEGRLFRLASAPFIQDPYRLIERPERALKDAEKDMNIALSMKLDEEMSKVFALRASLKSLSPFSTLSRGYALVEKGGGILSGVKNLKEGDEVKIVMQDGELKLKVEKIEVRK
ncbi:MAG: exodeoxyribonuclease VII large subunit, partial [Bifidobacteriaceae bacterium]|nr:exodeoxyribonuclease VII large subunit [Bifidobacteriaceae bacterium]